MPRIPVARGLVHRNVGDENHDHEGYLWLTRYGGEEYKASLAGGIVWEQCTVSWLE